MATGVLVSAGCVVGSIVAMPLLLGTEDRWWYLFLIELVLLLLVAMMLPFLPESPR